MKRAASSLQPIPVHEITLLKYRIPPAIPKIPSLNWQFTFPIVLTLIILKQEMIYAILVVIA